MQNLAEWTKALAAIEKHEFQQASAYFSSLPEDAAARALLKEANELRPPKTHSGTFVRLMRSK